MLDPGGYVGSDGAEVLQDELGRLRLPGAGLARDDQALVDQLGLEALVRGLGQGEDVGWLRAQLLLLVLEDHILRGENKEEGNKC